MKNKIVVVAALLLACTAGLAAEPISAEKIQRYREKTMFLNGMIAQIEYDKKAHKNLMYLFMGKEKLQEQLHNFIDEKFRASQQEIDDTIKSWEAVK